jgi:predicted transcriptional regulator of viral defense system
MRKKKETAVQHALRMIQRQGGIVRTAQALQLGIHPRTLYQLRDSGGLVQLSRGVYHLPQQEGQVSNLDLVIIATRIPRAVVCLVSALSFHELTTQVPHTVSIALGKDVSRPTLDYPPLTVYRFNEATLKAGIETHRIDGVTVQIYNPEKTLADCFKFRHKIGMDIVLEALKLYRSRKRFDPAALMRYAKVCRVEKIMQPYVEAHL